MANIFGEELSRKEFLKRVGNAGQIAYIRPCELKDGKSDGLRAFDVTTGELDFTVLQDKCLDIAHMKYKGVNISFLSKPGLVSPEYFNPHGNEFGRSFEGGMLYTCGLSNVGSPCVDGGKQYNQHGRIGQTPASNISAFTRWEEDEYILEISGQMRQAALFEENLVLSRRITTRMGAKTIRIHDEVENQSFCKEALMILYHFNFGYPVLDSDTRLILPAVETKPRDEEAEKGLKEYSVFCSPVDQYDEQVFYHRLAGERNGDTLVGVANDRLQLGVYIKYNIRQLPRLIQWKSMKSGDYALGIEPANCLVEGRSAERERGTLQELEPFEKACFDLEIGILDGMEEIRDFENKVKYLEETKSKE